MRAYMLYFSAFAVFALGSFATTMQAQSTSSYPTYLVDAQVPIVSSDGFRNPFGIAVALDGTIYVADTGNNRVLRFDTSGNQSTVDFSALSPALGKPTGVAVDGSGNLYVADIATSRLIKLAPGAKPVAIMKYPTVNQPLAVASDSQGNLAVINLGISAITARRAGGLPFLFNTGSTVLLQPESVAFDKNGILYVADVGRGTTPPAVYSFPKFGGTGTNLTPAGYNIRYVNAIAVDQQLNLFILDGPDYLLIEVPPSGGTPLLVPQSNFRGPNNLAVDKRGNLYVSDSFESVSVGSESSNTVTEFAYHNAGHFGYRPVGVLSNPPIVVNYSFYATTEVTAIRNLGLVGPGGAEFVPGGGTCALNQTYTPEWSSTGALLPASCSVWMRFRPAYPGGEVGAAQLSTSNGSMTQLLHGIGQGPQLAVSFPTILANNGKVQNNYNTTCNGAGDCYFTKGQTVVETPGDGSPSVTFKVPVLRTPNGLVVDPDGSVWITDMGPAPEDATGYVVRLDPPTGKVTKYPSSDGFASFPTIDSRGNLYFEDSIFLDSISGTSLELAFTDGYFESFGPLPSGLTMDASNTFYTQDAGSNNFSQALVMFGLASPEGQSNIELELPLAYPNDDFGSYPMPLTWGSPTFLPNGALDVGPSLLDLNHGAILPQDFAINNNIVTVYLFNIGNQDLVFTDPDRLFTESGNGAGKFAFQQGSCTPGGVVHPSSYCTIVVSSNIASGPNLTDTLHFLTNAVNNNSASFRMTAPPKTPSN